jgi:hypothetical protein
MPGDVIELPHLKDEYALNDLKFALKRFYVVEDVNRAAEGFSVTWYPHLYRLKLKQIYDGQEYKEILDLPAEEGSENTLRDLLSTYEKEMQISNAVVAQAEVDAPKSGYDINHYYTVSTNDDGTIALRSADETDLDASNITLDASNVTLNSYITIPPISSLPTIISLKSPDCIRDRFNSWLGIFSSLIKTPITFDFQTYYSGQGMSSWTGSDLDAFWAFCRDSINFDALNEVK